MTSRHETGRQSSRYWAVVDERAMKSRPVAIHIRRLNGRIDRQIDSAASALLDVGAVNAPDSSSHPSCPIHIAAAQFSWASVTRCERDLPPSLRCVVCYDVTKRSTDPSRNCLSKYSQNSFSFVRVLHSVKNKPVVFKCAAFTHFSYSSALMAS